MKPTIFLTGATSGIGLAVAKLLLEKNIDIVCLVRNIEKAKHFIGDDRPRFVSCDLADPRSLEVVEPVFASCSSRIVLINNAGIAVPGPIECLSASTLYQLFAVNVFGAVELTRLALPFVRKNGGRVINVGSISGEVAFPALGGYAATKFALRAITDALRLEIQSSSVQVSLVEPGSVETPIWDKGLEAGNAAFSCFDEGVQLAYSQQFATFQKSAKERRESFISARKAADVIVRAALSKKAKARYLVGSDARQLNLLRKMLPIGIFDKLRRNLVGWVVPESK